MGIFGFKDLVENFINDQGVLLEEIIKINFEGDMEKINKEIVKLSDFLPEEYITPLTFYISSNENLLSKFEIKEDDTQKFMKAKYMACKILENYDEFYVV